MKTRLLLNLVLICVVAALGLVAFFEPGKETPQSTPLTKIDDSALDSFTLQAHETIVFERRDGHWWIRSPLTAPANEIRVRQLLDVAKAETDAQYPLKPEDLAKYELDKPAATLIIGDTTLHFGGSDPIDMRRYVQVGETLYLVRDDFSHHLNAGATDYVDKKLLPEGAKITSIALPGVKATLSPEGKWVMQPPAASDSSAAAAALLNAWQSARAIDVTKMAPATKDDLVRIGLADGSTIEFVILEREPELLLGRADWGLQYEMVGEVAKQLLNQAVPEDDKAAEEEDDQPPELEHDEDEKDKADTAEPELEITDPDAGEGEDLE